MSDPGDSPAMTFRSFALQILESRSLAVKLAPPPAGLDEDAAAAEPGPALRVAAPARPENLRIVPARQVKVPPIMGMADRSQRARILHAFANHELQAAEIFAWALLAFADMPVEFRKGLFHILLDEQRHCRLYLECLENLGGSLGDYPVTGHFWNKLAAVRTPLEFVCTMGLTFENANLDFAVEYAEKAREVGDECMVRALAAVHDDEVRHVAFGWDWLGRLKDPAQTPWEAYLATMSFPLGPERARGKCFDLAGRQAAGLDAEFIANLQEVTARRPNGLPR